MAAPTLHVAPFLWSGAGRVITDLCLAQRRRGPVVLVTTGRHQDLEDWPSYRRALARGGVRHVTLDTFHRDAATMWRSAARLARLIDTLAPRVIHAHAGTPVGLSALARDIAGGGTRLVGQMYSWGPDRPAWMNAQDLWAFRQADVVVSSARAYSRLLEAGRVPRRRIVYLPWGLPLDALPMRSPGRVPSGPPILGFVGRLEPRKGQVDLVEAFARLRRAVPEARLELVGPAADAAYVQRLEDAIRRHRLGDAVRVMGRVPEIARVVRRWALFVSLSADEGQGLAVLEAMALGVPVLARRVAGIEDFLADGRTGWAAPAGGAVAIGRSMRRVLEEDATPVTARARAMVERRYDWAAMLARVERLYRA